MSAPHHHIAIVGTGFGGIGAAVRLMEAGLAGGGLEDGGLVLFERADRVGGVWRDNVYPGAACDVHSHLYEFSFAPNPDWSRRFSRQPEIQDYLEDVADRFGVTDRVRFGHDVLEAAWSDDDQRWHVETSRGPYTADVLVAAPGGLADPRLPDVPGLEGFTGTAMHTSRWEHAVDLEGARVAVVGTGASAIQVVPEIQPIAGHLTLFQRTPPWVMPRRDRPVSETARRHLRERPLVQRAVRQGIFRYREIFGLAFRHPAVGRAPEAVARAHLRRAVSDPGLRRVLTPDYRFGCKRVLLSDDYYPALVQPNVTVVDGPLVRVDGADLFGPNGVARPADVVILATGFYVAEPPFAGRVVARGRRLSDVWSGEPAAHLGTTVAGVPNFFLLSGPNTGLGHSSVVLMVEAQIEHVVGALEYARQTGTAVLEPTADAQAAFVAEVDRRAEGTVWTSGGCESWYLDAAGRNTAIWPGSAPSFRRRVAPFDPAEYGLEGAAVEGNGRGAVSSSRPPAPSATRGLESREADEPSALDRVRGAAARALGALPEPVQLRLAGGPDVVEGARLDPALALVLAANDRPEAAPVVRSDPRRARARLRREILSVAGRPTPVGAVRDLEVGGAAGPLGARLYTPAAAGRPPLTVFFHGGGFVEGDLDTHDEPCRLLCAHAGHAVLSVAYRLAPEHPFPAAADDVVAAFEWARRHAGALGADAGRVCVAGDSAGGNLAAVVAQPSPSRQAGGAGPAAQLLIYPATDHPTDRPSRHLYDGYLLTEDTRRAFFDVYTAGTGAADDDPRVSPIYGDLEGSAPALVVTAGFDVLRDEGEAYARALEAAGTPVALYRQPDLPHGFVNTTAVSPAARRATVSLSRRWRLFVREHS